MIYNKEDKLKKEKTPVVVRLKNDISHSRHNARYDDINKASDNQYDKEDQHDKEDMANLGHNFDNMTDKQAETPFHKKNIPTNIGSEKVNKEDTVNLGHSFDKIATSVGFLDQEWKDRNTGSKVGYVLANIFTLGGITWGRKMISSCEKCLDNINRESEIIFGNER